MKLGVPWRVKGIRPDARETAREAARRAGMSVGDWLNSVILDSADEEGVRVPRYSQDDEDDNDQLFAVHERLDQLTRQFERLKPGPAPRPFYPPMAQGPEAYAPQQYGRDRDQALAEAIARLDRRMDELVAVNRAAPAPADAWMPDSDQAMAEIHARMQALDADPNAPAPAPRRVSSPAAAMPMPAQNLAGLEDHLRHITGQIEALRQQPQLQEGLAALRDALSDVARTLLDAMPKRALEALEGEVRTLAQRLDSSRGAGVDANTLAGIEGGLTEVLNTLQTLRPAENLNGFREAVHSLAQKIDALGASGPDANTVQQIETAVTAMQGFAAHVASNEALAQLAGEVRALAAKVDQVAAAAVSRADHTSALQILDQRVAHIAEALESRVQHGGSVPPQLEAVIQGLTEKIERLQLSRGDDGAFGILENRVAGLVEKLDASGARFSQLEAIERGLADLLAHVESQRSAQAAAGMPQVDGLQRDLARTQTSLEAVHGTLGHVVDRLAMLEGDLRERRAQPAPRQPVMPPAPQFELPPELMPPAGEVPVFAPEASSVPASSREMAHAQAVAAMARANPKPPRQPLDPDLPPDQPLEPGFNPRGRIVVSPADRIAASEAALGSAKPDATDKTGKSNFIAAARRAARAAASEPTTADLRAVIMREEPQGKAGKTLAQRLRKLFAGTGVILITGGALFLASNIVDFRGLVDLAGSFLSKSDNTIQAAPGQAETLEPGVPQPAPTAAPAAPPNPETPPSSEVTGSTRTPNRASPPQSYSLPLSLTLPPSSPWAAPPPDRLPSSIGGPILREAAIAGDPTAEYEVGLRYAEGRGVTANHTEAVRWLEAAAKQGLAMAQFRLAGFYEKGVGVKKDVETARRLYKTAAEQGNAKAMHNLAVLYAEGAAVKPDYHTAAQWFRSAADHGVADAQYNLAILYARGIGVEQNLVESYKWFALAANQGDQDAAKKRDEVGKRLDAQALASAKLAVKAFKPQPQPEAATTVKLPPGGWDAAASNATENPPAKPKRNSPIRLGSR